MKIMIKVTFCLVFVLIFVSFAQAQKVPKAIKAQIKKDMGCDVRVSIVKIGPSKYGYEGSCEGGTNVYEKASNGIREIFEAEYGMNGFTEFSKRVYRRYYEIELYDSGGAYLKISASYRYNGNKYVRYKCVEWNLENPKKPRSEPCSF
jgi:hypothetical protein